MKNTQLEILLPSGAPHGFDYLVPDGMTLMPGDYVSVPFGRGESLGVVWGAGTANVPAGKMKSILRAHPEFPALCESTRAFIDWAAWYNCAPKGAMLRMLLPLDDIDKKGRVQVSGVRFETSDFKLSTLSDTQRGAADAIKEKIGGGFSVTLLDGVTGSGKTEVYYEALAHILRSSADAQVLILLPEIALSVQSVERFEQRFGFSPVIWNSEVTPARKRAGWQTIARGEARVVIGARSALFLPYRNLRMLIVDEEHDQSYKQEEGVIYHARDMAVARARFEKLPVVLVSATPSLETHHNARQGKYQELTLPARHGVAQMPEIYMLDMRAKTFKCASTSLLERAMTERGAFISNPLREKLAEALADGHQSLLFLNRRGYAPLMLCRTCGHRFQCPECSSWLVLHKKGSSQGLHCHHCGYHQPVPPECPSCHDKDSLRPCGPGVERLEEEVREFLPQARVKVMASDSMDNFSELSETIDAMTHRQIDVLIGTQMIAKGHHFAGISVVGVVDADLGLAGGDLRAAERTYQLLHQLSGRAGRESTPGSVYLQSYLPDHPVMQALLSGERDAFFAAELEARRDAHMPPFSRLAAVIVEGAKEDQVVKTAKALAAHTGHDQRVAMYGPTPAPLYMLRGKYRYRLLLKAERNLNLSDFMKQTLLALPLPSSVRVKIDIDPIGFL